MQRYVHGGEGCAPRAPLEHARHFDVAALPLVRSPLFARRSSFICSVPFDWRTPHCVLAVIGAPPYALLARRTLMSLCVQVRYPLPLVAFGRYCTLAPSQVRGGVQHSALRRKRSLSAPSRAAMLLRELNKSQLQSTSLQLHPPPRQNALCFACPGSTNSFE